MIDSKSSAESQGLAETFASMADEELLERWSAGLLTDTATKVARVELKKRGIDAPELASIADDALNSEIVDTSEYVEIFRSLDHVDIATLWRLLRTDGIPADTDSPTGPVNRFFSIPQNGIGLLVPKDRIEDATQLIALYRSGAFEVKDDDVFEPTRGDPDPV